jgi:hypothetical protein
MQLRLFFPLDVHLFGSQAPCPLPLVKMSCLYLFLYYFDPTLVNRSLFACANRNMAFTLYWFISSEFGSSNIETTTTFLQNVKRFSICITANSIMW